MERLVNHDAVILGRDPRISGHTQSDPCHDATPRRLYRDQQTTRHALYWHDGEPDASHLAASHPCHTRIHRSLQSHTPCLVRDAWRVSRSDPEGKIAQALVSRLENCAGRAGQSGVAGFVGGYRRRAGGAVRAVSGDPRVRPEDDVRAGFALGRA